MTLSTEKWIIHREFRLMMSDATGEFAEYGIDIQEAVKKRLALNSKKTVQLNDLLHDTKFTKSEIRMMYRGFKQVGCFFFFRNFA